MSALLPGEMQSGARMGIIYLTGGGVHKSARALTSGSEEANSALMVGGSLVFFVNLVLGSSWGSKQSYQIDHL